MKKLLISEAQQPRSNRAATAQQPRSNRAATSKQWLLMIFFFVLFAVGGQQKVLGQCYTNSNVPNAIPANAGSNYDLSSNYDYRFRLYIHVLRTATGLQGEEVDNILSAVSTLQNDFAPKNISFFVECIEFIDNSAYVPYSGFVMPNGQLTTQTANIFQTNRHADGIDIYILPRAYASGGGLAENIPASAVIIGGIFPSISTCPESSGFKVLTESHTLTHEIGHCLGLFHTFHGTCAGEVNITANPNNPSTFPELVNYPPSSEACLSAGDFVCDTDADPGIALCGVNNNCEWDGITIRNDCVTMNFDSNGALLDANNDSYTPPLHNFMSYSRQTCVNEFTTGQRGRMVYHISNLPFLQNTLVEDDDPQIATYFFEPITIPIGTTNWTSPKRFYAQITVPSGATLNITNTNIEFVGQTASIVVKKGGILRITNATLKAPDCIPMYWNGISIEGNTNQPHPMPAAYLANGSTHHGTVIVRNNSTIKNALAALHSVAVTDVVGVYVGGGIVNVTSSLFEDNFNDIVLDNFNSTQRSVIQSCQFITATNFTEQFSNVGLTVFSPTEKRTHIALNQCGMVRLGANTFANSQNSGIDLEVYKGTGIVAANAGIRIGQGSANKNTFSNLFKGIDVYSTLSATNITTIEDNEFLNVIKGITLNSTPFANISGNSMLVNRGNTYPAYGIMLLNSFGSTIHDNNLQTSTDLSSGYSNLTNGIELVNTAYNTNNIAVIQNNTFSGYDQGTGSDAFTYALRMQGNNQYTNLICNHFLCQNMSDWHIVPSAGAAPLTAQGSCFNSTSSFTNQWHTPISSSRKHISTSGSFPTITLYCDANSAPATGYYPSSYVDIYLCEIPSTICTFVANTPVIINCQNAEANFATEIQRLLNLDDYNGIINLLLCIDQVWAKKLLIGSYISQTKLNEAKVLLSQITLDTPDNIAFVQLFTAIIDAYESQINTGGKINQSALTLLKQQATDQPIADLQTNNVLAQSAMAILHHKTYVRNSEDKTEEPSNFVAHNPLAPFYFTPNPSTNTVQLQFTDNTPQLPAILYVYDIQGKLVHTATVNTNSYSFNVQNLATGIYFCRLGNDIATVKLSIIH